MSNISRSCVISILTDNSYRYDNLPRSSAAGEKAAFHVEFFKIYIICRFSYSEKCRSYCQSNLIAYIIRMRWTKSFLSFTHLLQHFHAGLVEECYVGAVCYNKYSLIWHRRSYSECSDKQTMTTIICYSGLFAFSKDMIGKNDRKMCLEWIHLKLVAKMLGPCLSQLRV